MHSGPTGFSGWLRLSTDLQVEKKNGPVLAREKATWLLAEK
jgi:hypothetical protein